MKFVERIGRPFAGSISSCPWLLLRQNRPVSDIVDSPTCTPLRTLPYSQVSDTYDSGSWPGSLVTMLPELFQFSVTSHEMSGRRIGVPATASSRPRLRVAAPFRWKRVETPPPPPPTRFGFC